MTSRVSKRAFLLQGLLAVVLAAGACSSPPPPTPTPSPDQTVGTNVYVTAYTWQDNTPAGSPTISHPVLHKTAGGTGTYEDPVTIAVGHSLETGKDVLDFAPGTRIYLPHVRRYFIVEDTCGDGPTPQNGACHTGAEEYGDASIWLDMWIGGQGESGKSARQCTMKVTGVHRAVFDPPGNYVVATGSGVMHDGKCDSGYGNELVTK
ncbi:MAG: hypothetical protein NVS3B6_21410 [Pseudarthrobacter sp.]